MIRRGYPVIVFAVLVSLVVHVALMAWVRTRVMTHVANATGEHRRPEPMRFSQAPEIERPTSLEELLDLQPLRDAPAAETERPTAELAAVEPGGLPVNPPAAPEVATDHRLPIVPKFELPTPKLSTAEQLPVLTHLETPAAAASAAMPEPAAGFASPVPSLPPVLPAAKAEFAELRPPPEKIASPVGEDSFKPGDEVFAEVDAKVVEAEKAAVRSLVNAGNARELEPFVEVALRRCAAADGWYFELELAPKPTLKCVPKDVVVILDASGSVGVERMGSIRKASKRILRSATNTGDRFNLVAFRDRYAYAFRSWQECTQSSFDRADRWLNNLAAHGRTDVFSTIESVLTLPRHPGRPLIALVVTDGDANVGVSDTAEIISKFTELNDGLVSVYMYGVKSSSNRELMDGLTHGNRGESFVFEGWRWNAGEGIEPLSERFRDPVLSDLRIVFASSVAAETYPRRLRNLYRGGKVSVLGRVPAGCPSVAFSLKGLSGARPYESYFKLPLDAARLDPKLPERWRRERQLDFKIRKEK